jgi:hypothetical protein
VQSTQSLPPCPKCDGPYGWEALTGGDSADDPYPVSAPRSAREARPEVASQSRRLVVEDGLEHEFEPHRSSLLTSRDVLWAWMDSNHRPDDYESPALTPELQARATYAVLCPAG